TGVQTCALPISKGVPNHAKGVFRKFALGHDVVGTIVVDRVYVAAIDKLHQLDGLLGLELDVVDVLVRKKDVLPLVVFVSAKDLVLVDRTDARHDLFITDTLARWLMHLVKGEPRSALSGCVELDR